MGRFEILREIGRGGFGVVYEALDRQLGRSVAFKTLRPVRTGRELSEDWILEEAEAVARLDHPAIVTLYDVGRCESGPYLVEEMLRGETLQERLRRGAIPPGEAVVIGLELARALAHAHGHGVLHRDLKPGNVFLTEDGRVKLLDFGLAHLLGTRGLPGGGTPAYMAPEQLRGDAVDARADVFALGATLFEMLAGRAPFLVKEGRSAALDGAVAPLPQGVPALLSNLVARCLSLDPAGRPASGQAVAEDLLAIQRTMESKEGRADAGRAPARRKMGRIALALAGLGLVAAAGIYLVRERSARYGPGTAAAPGRLPSVAVLAFADMSPGKDHGYLSDGIAEEVLNGLAQVDGVRVIGRTTSFSYKGKDKKIEDIGRELGVGAVLEGSVRESGHRVRITAQLVQAADASTIWSQAFDRDLSDVFAVQEEIARSVVAALRVRLLAGRTSARTGGTTNPEALQLYLVGRDRMRSGPESSPKALEAFEKAASSDPRFALAWAGIANAIITIEAVLGTSPERRPQARAAAERAVALAPDLADGFLARADVRMWLENDWRGERADLERARSLAPGDAGVALSQGFHDMANGDLDRSIAEFERVTRTDPLLARGWLNGWMALGTALISRGDHEKGRLALLRALELFPGFEEPRAGLGMDSIAAGRPGETLAEAGKCKNVGYRLFLEALAHHDLGHPAESQVALDGLVRGFGEMGAYQIAEVHAWRGDADSAFEWLERARVQRDTGLFWVKTDPLLQKVRGDRRYAAFLAKVHAPVSGEGGAEPPPPALPGR